MIMAEQHSNIQQLTFKEQQDNLSDNISMHSENTPDEDTQLIPRYILQILQQENRPAIEAEKLHNHFKNLSFFDSLRKEGGSEIIDLLIHEVWRNVEFKRLPKLQIIFKEKDPSDSTMYIILSGRIGINVKMFSDDAQQNESNPSSKKGIKSKDIQPQTDRNGNTDGKQQQIKQNERGDKDKQEQIKLNQPSKDEGEDNVQNTPKANLGRLIIKQNQDLLNESDGNEDSSDNDSQTQEDNEEEEEQYFPQLGKKVAVLSSGQAFGEQALFKEGGLRNASVYTIEDSSVLVIRREKFLGVLQVLESIKIDKVQRIGNVIPFFNEIVSKALKDRLIYEFEEVSFLKGIKLTSEGTKGSYIYILKSGRVALEKKFELIEYKEKESMEAKKVAFKHRFSEFTTAELIGDEILLEKSKIYMHKKNLRASEYSFTSIVLSGEASFLRINKKRIIERFPKYIVEQLRQYIQNKLLSRKSLIQEYVQKVQPNFVEYHKNQLNFQKRYLTQLKIVNNPYQGDSTPLSQNNSPNKKVQFQNIVRNSILPLQQPKIDHSLEANKSLIKELQIIKLKRQSSLKSKNDNFLFNDSSLNSPSNIFDDNLKSYSKQTSQQSQKTFNQLSSTENKNSSEYLQNDSDNYFTGYSQNNQQESTSSRSYFSKQKGPQKYVSFNEFNSVEYHQLGQIQQKRLSVSNNNNLLNKMDISEDLQTEFENKNGLRVSQSIPSLTHLQKDIITNELKPLPPFIYNHNQQKQMNNTQKPPQVQNDKIHASEANITPSMNQFNGIHQKNKQNVISQEKQKQLTEFKNQQKSQISKKIECDVMKKEIIYQHMKTLKEYKQIDPFEEKNPFRKQYIQKKQEQKKVIKQSQSQDSIQHHTPQSLNKIQQNSTKTSLRQEKIDEIGINLQPIKENQHEELTSKQFIILDIENKFQQKSPQTSQIRNKSQSNSIEINSSQISNQKSNNKKILKLKLKKEEHQNHNGGFDLSERSKSQHSLGSTSILHEDIDNEEDNDQQTQTQDADLITKKFQTLPGHQKKKFYLLLDTWDMGIENLKMKELDLRNGLYRKGMIHKPPLEQIHKDYFEKIDEHQLKVFKKYQLMKEKKQQNEIRQVSRLVNIINPQQKPISPLKNSQHIQNNIQQQQYTLEQIQQNNSFEEIDINQSLQFQNNINKQNGNNLQSNSLNDLNALKKRLGDNINQLQSAGSLSNLIITNTKSSSPQIQSKHNNINNKLNEQSVTEYNDNQLTLPEINVVKRDVYAKSVKSKTEGDDEYFDHKQLFVGLEQNSSIYGISKPVNNKNKVNSIGQKARQIRQAQQNQIKESSLIIVSQKQQLIPQLNQGILSPQTDRLGQNQDILHYNLKLLQKPQQQLLPKVGYINENSSEKLIQYNNTTKNKNNYDNLQINGIAKYSQSSNTLTMQEPQNLISPNGKHKKKIEQKLFFSPSVTNFAIKQ